VSLYRPIARLKFHRLTFILDKMMMMMILDAMRNNKCVVIALFFWAVSQEHGQCSTLTLSLMACTPEG
jgi:hypothetical protein